MKKHKRIAQRLAEKYTPKIYWSNGDLESDYQYMNTLRIVREVLGEAALVAQNPYSDQVCTVGEESPLRVGAKIAKAIKAL